MENHTTTAAIPFVKGKCYNLFDLTLGIYSHCAGEEIFFSPIIANELATDNNGLLSFYWHPDVEMNITPTEDPEVHFQESPEAIAKALYTGFTISGVKDISDKEFDDPQQTQFVDCPDEQAQMFTVYGIIEDDAVIIADCDNKKAALRTAELLKNNATQ